jgi:hypothetical protein
MEIIVNDTRRRAFENSIRAMADFKTAFGRGLSSDFVAELYVADELGLTVVDAHQSGYGALGSGGERYQVKFRSDQTQNVDLNNFDFDYLVLVNLDENFQLVGMWRITTAQAREIFVERANFRKYQASQKGIKNIGEQIQTRRAAMTTVEYSSALRENRGRRWRDIRGAAHYPMAGEDAQSWVSRSRRENDAEIGLER